MDTNADQSADAAQTPPEAAGTGAGPRLHPVLFLVVAIVAGAAFFGISREIFPIFHVPGELLAPFPPPEIAVAREAAMSKARMLNASVALGIFGLLLGGLLGASEAAARRFGPGAWTRLVWGVLLGTGLGCLSGLLGQFLMEQLRYAHSLVPIARTTLAQMCALGTLGLGVGMAAGLGAGGRRRLLSYAGAGAFSGILAGLLFPVVCAFLMHRIKVEGIIIPGGVLGGRIEPSGLALWIGCLAAAVGLLVPWVTRGKAPTR
jgi:hypothetical protein